MSIGIGCLCLTSTSAAQDLQNLLQLTQLSGTRPIVANQQEFADSPKLIVMTTGRIVEGEITQSGGGYTVKAGQGSFLVPFKMVKLTAENRHEAYEKYLQLMPEETSTNHTALARWCVEYQLINDARTELKKAIFLDRQNQEAISLLQQLDKLAEAQAVATASSISPKERLKYLPSKSLEGLSPKTIREFTAAIQPILMNNCAKTGCHHAQAKNDFKLNYVQLTGYGNRLSTERNLQAVLNQIGSGKPEQSPFLQKASDSHAGVGKTLSGSGVGASQMLRSLESWTASVALQLNTESTESGGNRSTSPGEARMAKSKETSEDALVREILEQNRADAFDPSRFNRPPASP